MTHPVPQHRICFTCGRQRAVLIQVSERWEVYKCLSCGEITTVRKSLLLQLRQQHGWPSAGWHPARQQARGVMLRPAQQEGEYG